MDLDEFLLFIPLLIYGIALTELLGQWKRLFDIENWYAPYIITVIAFTETSIWNIYNFFELFTQRESNSYPDYLLALAGPLLLLLAVNGLIKDDNDNDIVDRDEFMRRIRRTYLLMGCFVVLHLLPGFQYDGSIPLRVAGAIALFATAIFRKDWLVYFVGFVWVVGLVQRIAAG